MLDENKIATLTGNAVQDDETYKKEGGFEAERDQFYFELRQGNNTFLVGAKDILLCLKLLEETKEVPEIDQCWWMKINALYGYETDMVESAKE